jgi:RNA polymerase sigma factor for flagellar operon FliA
MAPAPASRSESGEAVFLSHLATIERISAFVCSRHYVPAADADDFASHVKLKLIEDDYAILRKFEGRASLRTYLTIVIERLYLDYRISAWGKWRPSAEARRLGEVGVLLERLVTRDGYAVEEAYEVIVTNHKVGLSRADFEKIAARLPSRTQRRFEGDDVLEGLPSQERPADEIAADADQRAAGARVSAALQRALQKFDTQDRLILAMKFVDGRPVSEIASALRLEQKPLYRRLDRLLAELRTDLEANGIHGGTVSEIFDSPAVSIETALASKKKTG